MARKNCPPCPPPSHAAAAAEYASLLGADCPSSLFGSLSPRSNNDTAAAHLPSVLEMLRASAPPPSSATPSTSTSHHHQPMPMGSAAASLTGQFPATMYYPSVSPSSSAMPSTSTNHHQPMPMGSAAASLAWGPKRNHASLDPYASDFQPRASAASPAQHDHAGLDPYALPFAHPNQLPHPYYQAVRHPPTQEEVRSRLLRTPKVNHELLMSPQAAAHVVRLLHEGDGAVRRSVLAAVTRAVHRGIQRREGRDVFVALLGACRMRFDELGDIVDAVLSGQDVLVDIMKHDHGVAALQALITAVAPHDQLSMRLIHWLTTERLAEQSKCGELLRHCFEMMPYLTCSLFILFAIHYIEELLLSSTGSMYLAECFEKARNEELRSLEYILETQTSRIAMGQYSNYFLQRALQCGTADLKMRIARRLAADVVNLSMDKFGSFVVETCFTQEFSHEPLQLVLNAVLGLRREQLANLVRGSYSNYVVQKLLEDGRIHFRQLATALAGRIEDLPTAVLADMHAQQVMRTVKKYFRHRSRRYYR